MKKMDRRIDFAVKGMHCQSCEALIKDELSDLKWVKDIVISHKTGKGSVVATGKKITDEKIIEAIETAGYSASIGEEMEVGFRLPPEVEIEGMIDKNENGQFII